MSRSLVIDASVALKWVVTEPGSAEAVSLLDEIAAGAVSLLAPEHLGGEVANGLRKRVAQHVLSVEDACTALDAIAHLDLTFVGGAGRWFRCLPAALEWGITAYDALYVLLAVDLDAVLMTADQLLYASATGMPVRLLGH
ncbi:MAG: type II toxin-antitoxin system VapC family toxin [Actinomycetota bacterium]|nr:type II toxin-antitoxin system VapC family toxin [Actinomycetota bacterium]